MSRKIFLDAFYNQFSDFLDQLIAVFPNDSDFPAYKTGLVLLQKTNPKLVPEQVLIHVTPFEKTLRARDERFFIDYNFTEYGDDDALGMIISKMKDHWSTLSDNNKSCIWGYTNLLLDLATKCIE
jgi:hypothetical protein